MNKQLRSVPAVSPLGQCRDTSQNAPNEKAKDDPTDKVRSGPVSNMPVDPGDGTFGAA